MLDEIRSEMLTNFLMVENELIFANIGDDK